MPLAAILAGGLMPAVTASAPAAAPEGAYPAVAVLDAFRAACPTRDAAAAAVAGRSAAGWARVDPDDTPVAGLVAFGKSAGEQALGGDGRILGGATYRREVAGEVLYLVASAVAADGRVVQACRLYDPGERRAIAPDIAARWMRRAPDSTVDRPELGRMTWEPGAVAGQDSFDIYRVPAGSPVVALTRIDGIALKADWVSRATPNATTREGEEETK